MGGPSGVGVGFLCSQPMGSERVSSSITSSWVCFFHQVQGEFHRRIEPCILKLLSGIMYLSMHASVGTMSLPFWIIDALDRARAHRHSFHAALASDWQQVAVALLKSRSYRNSTHSFVDVDEKNNSVSDRINTPLILSQVYLYGVIKPLTVPTLFSRNLRYFSLTAK